MFLGCMGCSGRGSTSCGGTRRTPRRWFIQTLDPLRESTAHPSRRGDGKGVPNIARPEQTGQPATADGLTLYLRPKTESKTNSWYVERTYPAHTRHRDRCFWMHELLVTLLRVIVGKTSKYHHHRHHHLRQFSFCFCNTVNVYSCGKNICCHIKHSYEHIKHKKFIY